jgi:hypothetical protein
MITAALHSVPVSPNARRYSSEGALELARIASEIAERIEEMDELRMNAGADFVCRLATVARTDVGAFRLFVAVLHGRVECILDSYATQGDRTGREKQTMHYRLARELELLRTVFPEAANLLDAIRLSVRHHEDPMSRADVLRGASEND